PDGETRGAFQAFDKDVMLSMGDPDGEHIDISAETNGKVACISVGSEKHLELYSEDSDRTGMYLFDEKGNGRGFLDIFSDNKASMALTNGDYRIGLCFSKEGMPSIGLFKDKEPAVSLLINEDGKGYAIVTDPSTDKSRWLEP
ncbi:MAG: hypothetical protein ACYC08_05725, partial [Armatimonadota bacterium]